jgi:hypothetical protein
MAAKLAICSEQFGLFKFQKAFRCQAGTSFLSQLVGETHPDLRNSVSGLSGIMVKNELTRLKLRSRVFR